LIRNIRMPLSSASSPRDSGEGEGRECARDVARTDFLETQGYRVMRFQNEEVLDGMDHVLTLITEALQGKA